MKEISSRQNPEVKKVVELHSRKGRIKHNQFIAEGIRTCMTLIDTGHIPVQIYITSENQDFARQYSHFPITLVHEEVMQKMSASVTSSGILALFTIPEQPIRPLILPGLVLVHMADPGNMGTLMRTAAACNVKTIVAVDSVDPWSPKVVQASVGTIGMVQVYRMSWEQLITNKGNIQLAALVVSGGKKPQEVTEKNLLLVVGSEAHGIPEDYLVACSEKITLAMPGKTESLNAAIAGSIALYLLLDL
jgi:RNA methyltransferase, TrmH family